MVERSADERRVGGELRREAAPPSRYTTPDWSKRVWSRGGSQPQPVISFDEEEDSDDLDFDMF